MCDTMEVSYDDGDIVWVKLGPCWWPGEVWALDKLPAEMTKSFRKTPIAVVKFFEEDSFEYVKNANLIFKYNCSRKNEFIKKGMDLSRGKLSQMEKFPLDVVRAERLTHGDEDILQSPEFSAAEVRKTSYAGIFGTPAKTPPQGSPLKKGRLSGSAKRKSDTSPSSRQKITHPRIIQKYLKGTSDYKAHMLVQESKPKEETPATPDNSKRQQPDSDASPGLVESAPKTPPGNSTPAPGTYACHACNFTATRLNVMILHNKSHSAGFVPYTPPKKHKIKTSPLKSKTVKLESAFGRSTAGTPDKKPRKKPKNIADNFTAGELSFEVAAAPAKRKGGKIKDKEVKKPKTDIEIKNSLLADWSEDSDESMDILSSLKLTENQIGVDAEKQEEPEDEQIEKDEPESEAGPAKVSDETGTRKYASCFDFDDDDDTELPIESLGRKIPRLAGKNDDIKKSIDSEDAIDRLAGKETPDATDEEAKPADSRDLDAEIDSLLQETAVPDLPSLPGNDLKLAENFQKGKAIKFPDKEKDSTERLPIFKTKTFFRSRHSRSQDAIEKYVADNIGADKRPTYMEEAPVPPAPTDSFTSCESDSEPVTTVPAVVPIVEEPIVADVKPAKLTPKIMLKKMKIIVTPKKETAPAVSVSEAVSPKKSVTEQTGLKSPIKSTSQNIEDKWSNENLDKLLETDSFADDKKIESYGTTDDLLGTIEEVPTGIFHIPDNTSNHVDSSPKRNHKSDKKIETSKVSTLEKKFTSNIVGKQPQIKPDNVPTESDLQIAEALINLPARAGPPPHLVATEKSSLGVHCETPVQESTMEFNESDPSLNAAESLVQMSEAFAGEPVQIHTTPNTFTGIGNDLELNSELLNVSSETMHSQETVTSKTSGSHISVTDSLNTDLPNSEKTSKVVLSKIVSPRGREKILNFNAGSGLPPKSQRQKVIIRRTAVSKIQRASGDRFGDTSHEKLILSNKTVGGRDGDVQTFTIETPASDHVESTVSSQVDKVKKFFPGKHKLIIKPRGAVITSTGKILQAVEPKEVKKDEDVLFDINSMPIVLSEEILTPEALGTAVTSQETTAVIKVPEVAPEVKKTEPEKITKISSPVKKYNVDPPVSKPSNFILKPVMEKSASPNILSKSKIKSYKNLVLMDKQTAIEQKFPKQEDAKEATPKIVKTGPMSQAVKTEKYIILPSSGGKISSGERTQKIILNPQTGKSQVLVGRVNDSAQAENFPLGKPQKTIAKIIQNRSSNPQTSGNAIMILTNAQGVQSKIVLTSEHQRLLFAKKPIQTTAITPQSVVTSKGTILSPIATNRNKNATVTSHSIIAPRNQIMNPIMGNAIMSASGQLVPSRLLTKKVPVAPQKLIMTNNPNTRTILTGRPGQTILTSKGQLITQSSIVTSQSKISNIVKTTTVLSQPGRQLKLLKTSPPGKPQIIKTKQGVLSHTSDKIGTGEPTTLLLQSSPGKGQTFIRAPGERPLVIPQRGGVLQLTVAQFEHMQKTGQLVHKSVAQKSAIPSRPVADSLPKGQNPKFVIQKYTNSKRTAEQAGVKQKAVNVYSGNVPPLALIQSESPMKRQKLRELLTVKPDADKPGMRGVQTSRSSESKILIEQTKSRPSTVPQQIAPAVPTHRKTEMDTYLKTEKIVSQPENIPAAEIIVPPVSEVMEAAAAPPAESQLLAVPAENFGGPLDSFYLCVEDNGTLTPVNNQPLVLENNQLVPMVIEPPPPPRLRIEEPVAPLPSELPIEPAEAQTQGIILNTGDQQILLDRQTLLGLLSGEGQQLVTADGQRLILQGDVQQLISALAGNPEVAGLLAGGQQASGLLDTGDAAQSLTASMDPGNSSSIGNEFLFPRAGQGSANQDILAAALAGTDVFQQEPLISDSLNIVTGGHSSALGEMDSLSPDFQNLNASVSVHSHVSETSSTLNQPIMSPLEVPTKTGRQTDRDKSGIPLSPKNLEDSLAEIGVTTPSIPTSLDLPITVTDPRIAPKVSINPLSLACGVVYKSPGMLKNSMLSPGVRMSDTDSSQARLDYTYDSYGMSNQTEKINTARKQKMEYIHKKSSSKLSSDPILSSQTERTKKETEVAPSMPVLSSSMPRLDDSSSDGYADDHQRPLIETVQSKTYSPISMPLLTEDVIDEIPAESSSIVTHSETPREDAVDSYIETGESFVFSETKSMPVLMDAEPISDVVKEANISNDNIESTHLQPSEFEQPDSYLNPEPIEESASVEEGSESNKLDDADAFKPIAMQNDGEHEEVHHRTEENLEVQNLLTVQDVPEKIDDSNISGVAQSSSFPEDDAVSEVENYSEDGTMAENSVRPSNVAEIHGLSEELRSSTDIYPAVENVPHMRDTSDVENGITSEQQTLIDEPGNINEPLVQEEIPDIVQLPECGDGFQYSNTESEKNHTLPQVSNIIEDENRSSDTHSNVCEPNSDGNDVQDHAIDPEVNVGSNYISEQENSAMEPQNFVSLQEHIAVEQQDYVAELEHSESGPREYIAEAEHHVVPQAVNIEADSSKCSQEYSYQPEDNSVVPQNDIAPTDNGDIESENPVEDGSDNAEENTHIEPTEIVSNEHSSDIITESEAIVECEKQNEDFEMTNEIVNETEQGSLPVILDNGDEINEYHEPPVDGSAATLNNDDHTNDDLQLDNDVIEPSSVPSETCDSPGRPLTPYRLIHTPNDDTDMPLVDSNPPMDRLHMSCDPDQVPAEQASLSPNLNSTPSPELTQNYTDSSSDDSIEIPIQPSISVSQHAVQTMMCTDDRLNEDSGKKTPENSVRASDNSFTFDDER